MTYIFMYIGVNLFFLCRGVLSIQGPGIKCGPLLEVCCKNPCDAKQRWYINSNKTISNDADTNLVLDIRGAAFSAGTPIITYPYHGRKNQHFIIQQQ